LHRNDFSIYNQIDLIRINECALYITDIYVIISFGMRWFFDFCFWPIRMIEYYFAIFCRCTIFLVSVWLKNKHRCKTVAIKVSLFVVIFVRKLWADEKLIITFILIAISYKISNRYFYGAGLLDLWHLHSLRDVSINWRNSITVFC